MNLKTQAISGLKWTAGAKLGGQIVTWGITLVVMRLLSPSDYGLLAMATVFIAFLLMIAEVGLGPALIQKDEVSPEKLRQAFGIVLIVNTILLLLLNASAQSIAEFFGDQRLVAVLRVLSLQFPVIAFTVIPEVLLQRRLEFRNISLINFSSTITSSLVTLGMAVAQWGVWALVAGSLASCVWKAIAVNWVSPFGQRPIFSWTGMKGLLSFGGNITASRVLWFLYTQADTIIVGRVLGKEILGLYSVAMHLASLPVQRVSGILNQVAFPTFSRFQDDHVSLRRQLLKALALLSFFAFPVMWGISSNANEIVLVFLGVHWVGATLPLQLLALIMPLRMIANFLPSVSDALGHPEIGLQNVIVGCLVMPVAFYVASKWGIVGVAVAWVTVYPLVMLINVRRMLSVAGLGISEAVRAIAPSMLSAIGMYVAVLVAGSILHSNESHGAVLLVKIIVGLASYSILTFAFNRVPLQELARLMRTR
jgi:teichuronic acid exporter